MLWALLFLPTFLVATKFFSLLSFLLIKHVWISSLGNDAPYAPTRLRACAPSAPNNFLRAFRAQKKSTRLRAYAPKIFDAPSAPRQKKFAPKIIFTRPLRPPRPIFLRAQIFSKEERRGEETVISRVSSLFFNKQHRPLKTAEKFKNVKLQMCILNEIHLIHIF